MMSLLLAWTYELANGHSPFTPYQFGWTSEGVVCEVMVSHCSVVNSDAINIAFYKHRHSWTSFSEFFEESLLIVKGSFLWTESIGTREFKKKKNDVVLQTQFWYFESSQII